MDELLKQLVENKLLSEDTQKDLKEAFDKQITEAIEIAKKAAEEEVKVELTEKWIDERNQLIEALDKKVDDYLEDEMKELKENVEQFRDLEVDYAEKLTEAKVAMGAEIKTDMEELVETIDAFLEMRISVEMEELKEELDEYRRGDFEHRILEAFAEEFSETFLNEDGMHNELVETKEKLAVAEDALKEAAANADTLTRSKKLADLLSTLGAQQREVMETLLDKVATDKIDEAFTVFLPRLLKASGSTPGKEKDEVLAESAKGKTVDPVVEGTIITGDIITEGDDQTTTKPKLSEDAIAMLHRLGGVK